MRTLADVASSDGGPVLSSETQQAFWLSKRMLGSAQCRTWTSVSAWIVKLKCGMARWRPQTSTILSRYAPAMTCWRWRPANRVNRAHLRRSNKHGLLELAFPVRRLRLSWLGISLAARNQKERNCGVSPSAFSASKMGGLRRPPDDILRRPSCLCFPSSPFDPSPPGGLEPGCTMRATAAPGMARKTQVPSATALGQ